MASTTKPKAVNNPHNFVIVPSDQVQPDPSDEITDLLRAVARHHSETTGRNPASASPQLPALDTTFRATAYDDEMPAPKRSFGRWFIRSTAAILLAMGIGAAAMSWQTLGVIGKKAMVKWGPQFALSTSIPWEKFGLAAKSEATEEEDAAPVQAAIPAAAPADSALPGKAADATAAATSTDQLQSMSRALASANQEIETLKASIAELKASQQQMRSDLAKVSEKSAEPVTKPKLASAPPRPAVAAHKPPPPAYAPSPTASAPPPQPAYQPTYSTSQASAVPPPPFARPAAQPMQIQPQADPNFGSPPRPPMPLQ